MLASNTVSNPSQGVLGGQATPRIMVFSDIGDIHAKYEPDDSLAMTFLFMISNKFDIEGLVSSKDSKPINTKNIGGIVDYYAQDYSNLASYDSNYPTPQALRSVIRAGSDQAFSSSRASSLDTISPGAKLLIQAAHKKDSRPLNVLLWGGATEVAEAISADPTIIPKIRVFMNGSPDMYNDTALDPGARDFLYKQSQQNNLFFAELRDLGNPDPNRYPSGLSAEAFTRQFIDGHGALGSYAATRIKTEANGFKVKKVEGVDFSDGATYLYFLRGDYNDPTTDHWGGKYNQPNPDKDYYLSGWNKGVVSKYQAEFLDYIADAADRAKSPNNGSPKPPTSPTPPTSPAEINLSLSESSLNEDGGAIEVTVNVEKPPTSDLTIQLNSTSPRDISMPETITIVERTTSASFWVRAKDNDSADGDKAITIRANASKFTGDTARLVIIDDDSSLPGSGSEQPGSPPKGSEGSLVGTDNADVLQAAGTQGTTINGKGGDDTIHGSQGDDIIIGGEGSDRLSGGGGSDTFRYNGPWYKERVDVVTDFESGKDAIDFRSLLTPKTHGSSSPFRDYVRLQEKNGSTTISLNTKGDTRKRFFRPMVVLEGVTGVSEADILLTDIETVTTTRLADPMPDRSPHSTQSVAGDSSMPSETVDSDAPVLDEPSISTLNADRLREININGELIEGSDDDDTLVGGNRDDVLMGGKGKDVLTGGSGMDVFAYIGPWHNERGDVITDFEVGTDQIDFSGLLSGATHRSTSPFADYIQLKETLGSTTVSFNAKGDRHPQFFRPIVEVEGVTGLSAEDFVLSPQT